MARILSDKDLDYWSESEAIELIKRQSGLNHLPGDTFSYTNTGFYLLAKIVEKVSGMKFPIFLQENVFKPLGMNHTFVLNEFNTIIPKMTQSYQYRNNKIMKDIKMLDKSVQGTAGIVTTLEDMVKYDRNIYNNRLGRGGQNLINRWLSRRRFNNGDLNPYAYGIEHGSINGKPYFSHGGSISGYRSNYVTFPNERMCFIVFCNHERAVANEYSKKIIQRKEVNLENFDQVPNQSLKSFSKVSNQDLNDYAGYYVSKEVKAVYSIKPENGLLRIPFNTFGDLHFRVYPNETFICVEFPTIIKGVFYKTNQRVTGFKMDPFM